MCSSREGEYWMVRITERHNIYKLLVGLVCLGTSGNGTDLQAEVVTPIEHHRPVEFSLMENCAKDSACDITALLELSEIQPTSPQTWIKSFYTYCKIIQNVSIYFLYTEVLNAVVDGRHFIKYGLMMVH
jgi:hypothetical protein